MLTRSSGILLPVFSLPSPYGIGTLGKEAKNFIDFLKAAGQTYWQILPIGPTGYGDSPYQCLSSFAGNPYFIDLDLLFEDNLIGKDDLKDLKSKEEYIDYGKLYNTRLAVLKKAAKKGMAANDPGFFAFKEQNADWVLDYALFCAIKERHGMKPWYEWDAPIRKREPGALDFARAELKEETEVLIYIQYLFFKQWAAIKDYAEKKRR